MMAGVPSIFQAMVASVLRIAHRRAAASEPVAQDQPGRGGYRRATWGASPRRHPDPQPSGPTRSFKRRGLRRHYRGTRRPTARRSTAAIVSALAGPLSRRHGVIDGRGVHGPRSRPPGRQRHVRTAGAALRSPRRARAAAAGCRRRQPPGPTDAPGHRARRGYHADARARRHCSGSSSGGRCA